MKMSIDESMLYEMGYNSGFKDGIKGSILKADYENRLRADMVAMLTEIQMEIEKKSYYDTTIIGDYEDEVRIDLVELDDVNEVIQQKINSLKAESKG